MSGIKGQHSQLMIVDEAFHEEVVDRSIHSGDLGTPRLGDDDWDEFLRLFWHVTEGLPRLTGFIPRKQLTDHLWRIGYRPPGE